MDSSATALIIISLLTCAAMTAAAIVKPKIRVGRFSLSTYWIVTIAGALVILVSGLINPAYLIEGLTSDSAVNPVKILIQFNVGSIDRSYRYAGKPADLHSHVTGRKSFDGGTHTYHVCSEAA